MIDAAFVVIRFPIFAIGVVLYTAFIIILAPWSVVLSVLIVPLWVVFILPFQFIGFAFANDQRGLHEYIEKKKSEWLQIFAFLRDLPKAYGDMYNWLVGASKDAK